MLSLMLYALLFCFLMPSPPFTMVFNVTQTPKIQTHTTWSPFNWIWSLLTIMHHTLLSSLQLLPLFIQHYLHCFISLLYLPCSRTLHNCNNLSIYQYRQTLSCHFYRLRLELLREILMSDHTLQACLSLVYNAAF